MSAKLSSAGWLLIALYPALSYGAGGVTPSGATHEYQINLGNKDDNETIVNEANAYKEMGWDLGDSYHARIDCRGYSINDATYFKAVVDNPSAVGEDGFMPLNDFLDMRVDVWVDGNMNRFIKAPFDGVSNYKSWKCYDNVQPATYRSGSKGKITFRVRKSIINGIKIDDRKVVEIFGRLGTQGAYGAVPMSRVVINTAFLYVPEKCVINGGQTIEVEFGDLPGSDLDGERYAKKVPIDFSCQGGKFQGQSLHVNLGISGKESYFNPTYLQTTRDGYQGGDVIRNLGIKFKQENGGILDLNTFYPMKNMYGNSGTWGFIAAPISNRDAEIAAGDFYATATIVAAFD